jgi:hypothetical protein
MARAAFVYLLTGDTSYATPIRAELLNQITVVGTDWTNRTRWCLPPTNPSPYRFVPWVFNLLLSYDYLLAGGYTGFSAGEKTSIETWFKNHASYISIGSQYGITSQGYGGLWAEPPTGCDGRAACNNPYALLYYLGPTFRQATYFAFHNQAWPATLINAAVGVLTNTPALVTYAKQHLTGFIKQGMADNGALADFNRWNDSPAPNVGSMWGHTGGLVGPLLAAVDIIARAGDTSLYTQTQANQTLGSSGSVVGLETAVVLLARMANKTTQLYGTTTAGGVGPASLLTWDTGWSGKGSNVHFPIGAANLFYQNADIRTALDHAPAAGTSNSQKLGCGDASPGGCWSGVTAFWPDIPFMLGKMDGLVYPYTATGPTDPTCTISTPTTLSDYNTATSPLATLAGAAQDPDGTLGAGSVTWACPQCTPTSGTADGTTSWSETSIGLTDNADNVITVTVTDTDTNTGTCQLTVHYDSTPDLTGLVAYWPLNEASGNFQDATGNGHTATPSGGITRVAGQVGTGAVQFDGATGSLTAQGLLGFSASTPAITLSAWVRRIATGQPNADVVSLGNYVALRVSGTTATGFFYTGTTWRDLSAAIPNDTTWHHLAYTAEAGAQALYIDGVLAATGAEASAPVYTGQGSGLVIGHHGNGGAYWFAGTVDEVRVHNRVLSGTDIATLMTAGGTGSEELLHLPMNEDTGTTTADTSPNAVEGTLGTATWSTGRLGGAGLACASGGSCVVTLDGSVVYAPTASPWSVAYWGNLTAWGTGNATTSYAIPLVLRTNLANPFGIWYSGDTANSCDGLAFAQGDPDAGGVTGHWVVSAASLLGWHHVVLTYNGAEASTLSNYALYVDGIARTLTTTPCGGGGTQTSRLFLDGDGGAPDQWVGELDEVIVFSKALNQAQVTALATLSNPPTCTITTPASTPFEVSASPYTALAGSATDDTAVQTVTWLNTATQSGGNADCTNCGTTNATWTVASIPLVPGDPGLNPITVTVTDGEAQQGTCQVRLDYTPPPPPPAVGMLGPPGGLTLLP